MAKRKDRSERDRAGVGPDPHAARRLVPLNDLHGYDFAKGEPDVRGWDVVTLGGRELGEVEDVLVDPDRREVVMLEVDLREDGIRAEVPIRAVQLDRDRKVVLLDSGDLDQDARPDERSDDLLGDNDRTRVRRDYRGGGRTMD
jgi:sporulation protein YlmC with PRC-barrel domain